MKKSLVALKRLVQTVEEAIQLILQQIRQRCTLRQDLESPVCASDQLRLSRSRSHLPVAQDTSAEAELGIRALT